MHGQNVESPSPLSLGKNHLWRQFLEGEDVLGFIKGVTESEDPVGFEVSEFKEEGDKVSFSLTILVAGNPIDEGPAVAIVEDGKIKYTGICIP